MDKEELTAIVRAAICKEMHLASMPALSNETLLSHAGIDSLKAITILFALEDMLNIDIEPEVIEKCITVNDIVEQLSILIKQQE
jgi:acyl carrier protein